MREVLLKAIEALSSAPVDLTDEQVQERVKNALGETDWTSLRNATLTDVMKELTVGDLIDLAASR